MTSEKPSPFTSPAVATELPNWASAWLPSAVQAAVRREPRRRAQVDERPALVRLAVVVKEGADDDVRETIAVHVSRRCNRGAELGVGLIRLRGPGGEVASPAAEPK